jgi:hypothetical protein
VNGKQFSICFGKIIHIMHSCRKSDGSRRRRILNNRQISGQKMELTKSDNGKWKPGQSGNLNGRPVGHRTRHAFSTAFVADLAEVWAAEGKRTMLATARAQPETFFAVCARLIPRDVELTVRQHYSSDLDPADLEILRAIKSAIPDAGDRQPGDVFNVVLEAIKASNAKLIVCETVSAHDKS